MPAARLRPFAAVAASILLLGMLAAGLPIGCAPNASPLADAAAVEEVQALGGMPLPPAEHATNAWETDLAAARATAAAEGRDVLMLFTGSKWCHYCVKLEEQVFAQAPASRLTDDFVPVLLDFKRNADGVEPASARFAEQHAAASIAYDVAGFPTVLLTDPGGEVYAQLGYDRRYAEEGAAAFVADARTARLEAGRGGPAVTAETAAGRTSL